MPFADRINEDTGFLEGCYNPTSNSYECACGAHYKHARRMRYHWRHDCGHIFVCLCGNRTDRKNKLIYHIRTRHPDRVDEYLKCATVLPPSVQ